MILNQEIFKAYDVRGTYPDQIDETVARAIGTAFVAYLKATRIGVGRDMRLSSPSLAAAFIEGATSQGADVVDYGMIPTDMLYFAVARDQRDGGTQITASHNPKQYNGAKMVRQEAFPLSGDEGLMEIRDMIAADRLPPPAARRGHAVVDRAQLFSVVDRARRNLRRVRESRLLDRHRHAREIHAGAPRHHGPSLCRPSDDAVHRAPGRGMGVS